MKESHMSIEETDLAGGNQKTIKETASALANIHHVVTGESCKPPKKKKQKLVANEEYEEELEDDETEEIEEEESSENETILAMVMMASDLLVRLNPDSADEIKEATESYLESLDEII